MTTMTDGLLASEFLLSAIIWSVVILITCRFI